MLSCKSDKTYWSLGLTFVKSDTKEIFLEGLTVTQKERDAFRGKPV